MPKYIVIIGQTIYETREVEVEAKSADKAQNIAYERIVNGDEGTLTDYDSVTTDIEIKEVQSV